MTYDPVDANDDGVVESDVNNQSVNTDGASTGVLNSVTHLDQNDPAKPDVDDYLNNQLSGGDIVCIDPGDHTVSAISLAALDTTIIWRGTLIPSGDHDVFDAGTTAVRLTIVPQGPPTKAHIDTRAVTGYSSIAFKSDRRVFTHGVMQIIPTGSRGVSIENSGGNSNWCRAAFWLEGLNEGTHGLVVNSTQASPDCNAMKVWCRASDFTDHGSLINAGIANTYWLGMQNNGTEIGVYDGDGPIADSSKIGDVRIRAYLETNNVTISDLVNDQVDFQSNRTDINMGEVGAVQRGRNLGNFRGGNAFVWRYRNGAANGGDESVGDLLENAQSVMERRYDGNDEYVLSIDGTDVFRIDGSGDVTILGSLTENTAP